MFVSGGAYPVEFAQGIEDFFGAPMHEVFGCSQAGTVTTGTCRHGRGVMLKAFMDAIAFSDSHAFRRHVELVRWSLSLPGCLDSRTISRMYGRSHIWAQKRARMIRSTVNSDACGLFPHVNNRRDKRRKSR
mgnify:CR=1 FL=1